MPFARTGFAMAHPKPSDLGAFVRGELSGTERRDVLRHLLAGCRQCRQRASELAAPLFEVSARKAPAGGVDAYDAALRRVARAFSGMALEPRGASSGRAAELPASGARRIRRPEATPGRSKSPGPEELKARAQSWLQRARMLRYADPERMRAAAAVAVLLSERIPQHAFPPGVAADLCALSWAELANGRRLVGDHRGAERAFSRAIHWIDRGSGDLHPLAEIAELVTSLEIDTRRFTAAEKLLDRIVVAYRALGEPHCAGRTLIRRGVLLGYRGEGNAAVRQIAEGHSLLDPGRDARLALVVVHGLVSRLADAGRFELASEILRDGASLYETYAEPIDRIKVAWTRGRIEIGMGRLDKGEKYLREGSRGFRDRGMPYFAALVALDLAALHLKQGRTSEVARSIADLLAEFRALGIRREAIACLMILERAVATERATERLVSRIASRLSRFTAPSPAAVPAA